MELHYTRRGRARAGCERSHLRRRLSGRLLGLLCWAGATDAGAQCARAFAPGSSTHPVVDFGHVIVAATAHVGDVIATRYVNLDDATCSSPVGSFTFAMVDAQTALPNVHRTTVSGVGVRVLPGAESGNAAFATFTELGSGTSHVYHQFRTRVDLVKTGDIGTGTLSGVFYRGTATSPGFGSDITFGGGRFTAVSCSTSNAIVALPTVSSSALPHAGATAGATAFNLDLDCDGTASRAGATVLMTLTDSVDPANRSDRLSLAPASTAGGVQLQILKDGVPIFFGPDSSTPGATNQFLLGDSREITQTALVARYVRTGVVRPGTVLAMATFTLSYR